MAGWNPWHGCHKISPGCQHCYVYRIDARHDKNSMEVHQNKDFDLPIRRKRDGSYKIAPGEMVFTCFSSDLFVEEADEWRKDVWRMIRQRSDCSFFIVTKRIHRFMDCIPEDWGEGYENVQICCTCENQQMADYRLPIFLTAPIRHKSIICEPLLGPINLSAYLEPQIRQVTVGGESGDEARTCDYRWVLSLREQCVQAGIPFHFKQTGANFLKDGRRYQIERRFQQSQAAKAGIDYQPKP